jgi:hypothetical protein
MSEHSILYTLACVSFIIAIIAREIRTNTNVDEMFFHLSILLVAGGIATQWTPPEWHIPDLISAIVIFFFLEALMIGAAMFKFRNGA